MRKKIITLVVCLIMAITISACDSSDSKGNYDIFYINSQENGLRPIKKEIDDTNLEIEEIAQLLIDKLGEETGSSKCFSVFNSDVKLGKRIALEEDCLIVDFDESFFDISAKKKMLIEAAIVKTLIQISDCEAVSFTIDGKPLVYDDGTVVGKLTDESFVDNPGEKMSTTMKDDITLYFSDKKGTGLVKEECTVYYNSNLPLEKKVIEQLIEGPLNSDDQNTLPLKTKVITIRVTDGICYLNLDDTFRNDQNNEISEEVVLYSIVNSLTSLDGIDKVQIQVNGDTSGKVRFNCNLSKMYKMNNKIVVNRNNDVISTEEVE